MALSLHDATRLLDPLKTLTVVRVQFITGQVIAITLEGEGTREIIEISTDGQFNVKNILVEKRISAEGYVDKDAKC